MNKKLISFFAHLVRVTLTLQIDEFTELCLADSIEKLTWVYNSQLCDKPSS